jgi:zinc/manganese transport system substrate-binding protein
MKIQTTFAAAALTLFAVPAAAEVRIMSCEPTWSALATELGGDQISAESATTPFQDRA